jgi:predicted transcriptional regulator of viral defense system
MRMIETKNTLQDYIDLLQKRGNLFVSKSQAFNDLRNSHENIHVAFSRMVKKKRLFRLRRDFFGIIPIEYQNNGATPPDWFIDPMMKHGNDLYYVGLLSAAAIHGAAHQQPMQFQVITNNMQMRNLITPKSHIIFYKKKYFPLQGLIKIKTMTGYMWVSGPELTAVDLLRYPKAAGHLNNIATVFEELGEKIDSDILVRLAESVDSDRGEMVYWQRLGYLLDTVGYADKTEKLVNFICQKNPSYKYLSPIDTKKNYEKSDKWRLYINKTIEIDL